MREKLLIIFVGLLLILTLSVYAEDTFLCGTTDNTKDYSCEKGSRTELSDKGFSCAPAASCNKKNCCGDVSGIYCCRKLCDIDFGSDGFGCQDGKYEELAAKYGCKSKETRCDKDKFCCGKGLSYCCNIKSEKIVKTSEFLELIKKEYSDFLGINTIHESETYRYKDLQEKSFDFNLKAEALYSEAIGYKEIALARRDFLGVLSRDDEKENEAKINTKEDTGSKSGGDSTAKIDETTQTEKGEDVVVKTKSGNEKSGNEIIKEENIYTNAIIIDVDLSIKNLRIYYTKDHWEWCETNRRNNECDGDYNVVAKNSPSDEDYINLLKPLIDKNFDDGVDALLFEFMKSKLKNPGDDFILLAPKKLNVYNYDKIEVTISGDDINLELNGDVVCSKIGKAVYSPSSGVGMGETPGGALYIRPIVGKNAKKLDNFNNCAIKLIKEYFKKK